MSIQYETVFIINPVLSEEQMLETVAKFKKFITDHKAEIVFENNWGMKKLAYPIEKRQNAYYCYMEFTSPTAVIPKMEQEFIYDESVIRFITVRVEKHHAAFNKKRREQGFGKKKEVTK